MHDRPKQYFLPTELKCCESHKTTVRGNPFHFNVDIIRDLQVANCPIKQLHFSRELINVSWKKLDCCRSEIQGMPFFNAKHLKSDFYGFHLKCSASVINLFPSV